MKPSSGTSRTTLMRRSPCSRNARRRIAPSPLIDRSALRCALARLDGRGNRARVEIIRTDLADLAVSHAEGLRQRHANLGGASEVREPLAETFRVRDGKVCEIRPYYFDPRPITAAVEARKRAAQG